MGSAPPPPITEALPDPQAWTARFAAAPLPVPAETAALHGDCRADEDAVDALTLAQAVSADPLMSLKRLLCGPAGCGKTRVLHA